MKLKKCQAGTNTNFPAIADSLVQIIKANNVKLFSKPSYHLIALGKRTGCY
jgi:hypothetical protein